MAHPAVAAPTFRAALSHLSAAARLVLDARNEEAGEHTMTALLLAGSRTSHLGALARTMHGVIQLYVANGVDAQEDLTESMQFLLRSGAWVPGSPEVAYVIGAGLARAGLFDLVRKWAAMIVEPAEAEADDRLCATSSLLFALCATNEGRFEDARSLSRDAAMLAVRTGFDALAVRASSMSGFLDLLVDEPGHAADPSARILPAALAADGGLRVESQIAMALSEIVADDPTAASTWLCSAFDSLSDQSLTLPLIDSSVALMGTMLLLIEWPEAAVRLLSVVCPNSLERSDRGAMCSLLRGIAEENPDSAIERLDRAATDADGSRLVRSLASLSKGVRLLRSGEAALARVQLEELVTALTDLELRGLVHVVTRLIEQSESGGALAERLGAHGHGQQRVDSEEGERTGSAWRLTLLGDFVIECEGARFDLPQSVSTQALKYIAVRRRVTVDELVDVLWPESDHEVGTRRLRNVLWRIRSACGDLVYRDGNLICLSPSASTDIEDFESLTSLALSSDFPTSEAGRVAGNALALYAGPLLPGDLFVDWTVPYRESLGLLHVRVLDYLLGRALDQDRTTDALSLLERMIEAEPFEETHYIQAAELYAQSGRLQRARRSLDRANRMLLELGVEPSPAYLQVRQKLSTMSA
jgi:DNA-binding SARP family transcriptional activator